jgi:hypothetical protein
MERLPTVLLYEIARMCPLVLLSWECVSSPLRDKITRDVCYIQTLIEDLYQNFGTRSLTYKE